MDFEFASRFLDAFFCFVDLSEFLRGSADLGMYLILFALKFTWNALRILSADPVGV